MKKAHATIAPQTILTAKHCLYHDDGRPIRSAIFQAGYGFLGDAYYVNAVPLAEGQKFAEEWALLRLERSLDIKPMPIYFAKSNEVLKFKPEDVMLLGYNDVIEKGNALSYDTNCSTVDGNPIFTACRFSGGGSGGPLVIKRSNRWVLVGLAEASRDLPLTSGLSIFNLNQLTPIEKAQKFISTYAH